MTSLHVQRAIRADRTSTAWIVSRFTPLLLCQARQRIPPSLNRFCDASDVVADVWMAVLPALARLKPSSDSLSQGLLRYAGTSLNRRVRDLVEKHVLGKPATTPIATADGECIELADDARGVITHVVLEERKGRVWETLDRLPPDDREIMVLRGIEGRPHKEIAERIGLSPENVAVRYHRLLKQLREILPESVFADLEE